MQKIPRSIIILTLLFLMSTYEVSAQNHTLYRYFGMSENLPKDLNKFKLKKVSEMFEEVRYIGSANLSEYDLRGLDLYSVHSLDVTKELKKKLKSKKTFVPEKASRVVITESDAKVSQQIQGGTFEMPRPKSGEYSANYMSSYNFSSLEFSRLLHMYETGNDTLLVWVDNYEEYSYLTVSLPPEEVKSFRPLLGCVKQSDYRKQLEGKESEKQNLRDEVFNRKLYQIGFITSMPNNSDVKNAGKIFSDDELVFKTVDFAISSFNDLEKAKRDLQAAYKIDTIWIDRTFSLSDDVETKLYHHSGPQSVFSGTNELSKIFNSISEATVSRDEISFPFWSSQAIEIDYSDLTLRFYPRTVEKITENQDGYSYGFVAQLSGTAKVRELDRNGNFYNDSYEANTSTYFPIVSQTDEMKIYPLVDDEFKEVAIETFEEADFIIPLDLSKNLTSRYSWKEKTYWNGRKHVFWYNEMAYSKESPMGSYGFGYALSWNRYLIKNNMARLTSSLLNLKSEMVLKNQEDQEKLKPLYSKYGRGYVESALQGTVIVGMHQDLLDEATKGYVLDSSSQYTGSYVLHMKYVIDTSNRIKIWVSKRTNKVTSVSYYSY